MDFEIDRGNWINKITIFWTTETTFYPLHKKKPEVIIYSQWKYEIANYLFYVLNLNICCSILNKPNRFWLDVKFWRCFEGAISAIPSFIRRELSNVEFFICNIKFNEHSHVSAWFSLSYLFFSSLRWPTVNIASCMVMVYAVCGSCIMCFATTVCKHMSLLDGSWIKKSRDSRQSHVCVPIARPYNCACISFDTHRALSLTFHLKFSAHNSVLFLVEWIYIQIYLFPAHFYLHRILTSWFVCSLVIISSSFIASPERFALFFAHNWLFSCSLYTYRCVYVSVRILPCYSQK